MASRSLSFGVSRERYVAALSEQCRAKDIPILTNVEVVALIKEGSRVVGVEARFKNQLRKFYADKAVIMLLVDLVRTKPFTQKWIPA